MIEKKNTWLVTGGAGFIGSNLVNYLIEKKQKVICVDNFFNGFIKNIKKPYSKNLIFLKSDILEKMISPSSTIVKSSE